ncbi:MAG: hypothetical protein R6W99_02440 [Clostridia bacterium]
MVFEQDFERLDLGGRWKFIYSERNLGFSSIESIIDSGIIPLEGTVPGNFELDLFENGIISDPFFGKNIRIPLDYEKMHIWYFRTFEYGDAGEADRYLVFEGLDCIADVYINGVRRLSSDNMLISIEANVSDSLKPDSNEILVHFKPIGSDALIYEYPVLASGFPANCQSLYIRKAPHMFGWDILPKLLSAGIYRPVYIETRPHVRFLECYLQTSCLKESSAESVFIYKCSFDYTPRESWSIRLTGVCGESSFTEEFRLAFQYGRHLFNIPKPLLWNPRSRGTANIYNVEAVILRNGKPMAHVRFKHGIRTIRLKRESISVPGERGDFCFIVNGERLFVKGTNWVPADAFHSRDRQRIPRIMKMAADINCNMIRCWGGNLYEDDLFFDICDREGIMVWQDFAMACAVYPQDPDFMKRLGEEASSVIRRLRQHPCLALWAGDNECDQAYSWFGFDVDPNTNVLTRKLLPGAVRMHDPFRDYLPSSPYIDPNSYGKGDGYLPENHLWGKRDYFKSKYYSESTCRFASEMGYHGCPSPESIARFISEDEIWPYGGEEWLLHSTSPIPEIDSRYNFRVQLMADQIKVLFGFIPGSIEEFSSASQISQAEALKFFIELFRGSKWDRTGIIWWNLMDGWPQFSDAVVDYFFNKKTAYEYIKRSQRDILLMFREPEAGMLQLVACNDTRIESKIKYTIINGDNGKILLSSSTAAAADSVTPTGAFFPDPPEHAFYIISWSDSLGSGKNHYLSGKPPYDYKWYIKCLDRYRRR